MRFGAPYVLFLLLALLPVAAAMLALARWRRAAAGRLVTGAGSVPRTRRIFKGALLLTALALIALAAARPQRGSQSVVLPREGTDVMIALDVSLSMLATDVAPNRFERAKVTLNSLLDRLQGDRVGLVVFAGTAGLRFPLTTDVAAARELIRSATIKEGGLAAGTGIGDAIRVAVESFPATDETRSRVLLIVTDGEDTAGAPQEAVRRARDRGIIVSTMGIGTEAGGAIVVPRPTSVAGRALPPPPEQGTSRRDAAVLRQVATAGRGIYFDGNDDDPAAAVANEIGRLARTRFESQEGSLPVERFQWFLVAALVLLAVDFLLPDRPGRRRSLATDRAPAERAGRDRSRPASPAA